MPHEFRRLRGVLVGDADALHALLVDVLRDLRVEIEFIPSGSGRPDLAFALVRPGDVFRTLELAKRAALGAPIVAVLALNDTRLPKRAMLAGTRTVCSLDGPLDGLRLAFIDALTRRARDLTGIPPEPIETVSSGAESPAVPAHDERAWAKNRRDELSHER